MKYGGFMILIRKQLYKALFLFLAIAGAGVALISFSGRAPRTKTLFMPATGVSLPLDKEKTLIAFDIHAVLVEKNKFTMGWNLFKNVGAVRFANHESVKKHVNSVDKDSASPEDYFMPLIDIVPDIEPYIPGFLNVVNAQDPIPGMQHLLEKLNKRGYKLYILSNIGPAAYYGWKSVKNLQLSSKGLKDMHPHIFKHFTGGVQVASKKPLASAYTNFINTFAKPVVEGQKLIVVFVDDKLENILAATQQGFIGILFKNPKQLETDLMRLGIR